LGTRSARTVHREGAANLPLTLAPAPPDPHIARERYALLSLTAMDHAHTVLNFWFASPPYDAARLAERMRFWFGAADPAASAQADATIRTQLLPLLNHAAQGLLDPWSTSPRRRLALILLFDQVPRNAFRSTAAAYAFDPRALSLAMEGLTRAADGALDPVERIFFYMPLQHAEAIDVQDESVRLFGRLLADAPTETRDTFRACLEYAHQHREIIQRFGRFPHRNRVLLRESTPDEQAWLSARGATFGQ
jgi:uncharacterized protein (DUF924 family)